MPLHFKLKKIHFNKKLLLIISSVSIAIVLSFSLHLYYKMSQTNTLEKSQTIIFKKGSSIKKLASRLKNIKLLDSKLYFILWVKLKGLESNLKAGEYLIKPATSLISLLADMEKGNVIYHKISLIEGLTFKTILAKIQQHKKITAVLKNKSAQQIMQEIGHLGVHPEGQFYPDTYAISQGTTDLDLLKRAYAAMQKVLQEEWDKREKNLPLKSPYDALILASIIEKETAIGDERALIAGLFINRLNKDMRLQTDPTVIYGIKNFDGNIRYKDLRKDTPYNTYTRKGLPPTPIALVGRAALHAVLHPTKTDYIFFVALGDGSGRHKFSVTLAQHEAAVKQFLRRTKAKKNK